MQEAVISLGLGSSVRLVFSKESLTSQEWDRFIEILGLMRAGLVGRESAEAPISAGESFILPQTLRVEGGLRPEEAAKLSKEVTLVSTELTAKLPSDFNGPKKVTAYVVREYVKAELLRGIPAAKVAKESKKKFLKQGVGYHTVGEWCRQWKREGLKFPTVYNQRPGFKTPEEIRKYAEGCFKDGTSLQQILKWIEAKFGEDKVVHITTIYGWRNAWKRKQEKLAVKPEAEQTQDKQQVSPSPVKSEKVKYGSEVFVFVKGRLLQYESPEKIQEALAQRFPAFKDNPPLDVILEWRERLRRAGQIKRPA